MTSRRNLWTVLAVAALFASAAVADTGAQPVSKGMLLNGAEAPSGSTLFGDSLLSTMDKPATVNLVNGQTVVLAANSSARFAETASGDIRIAVEKGSASYRNPKGIVVAALENEFLIADQGGVQQGEPVDQGSAPVDICLLTSPTDPAGADMCMEKPKKKGCNWSKQQGDTDALDEQGAHYVVLEDTSFDCKSRKGWIALLGAGAVGGLGAGGTTAVVAGSVLGSAVIIDEIDDDSSSPTRPGG